MHGQHINIDLELQQDTLAHEAYEWVIMHIHTTESLHKHQDDCCAVTDVVHGSVIQYGGGVEGRGGCGDHNGNARQEEQGA